MAYNENTVDEMQIDNCLGFFLEDKWIKTT